MAVPVGYEDQGIRSSVIWGAAQNAQLKKASALGVWKDRSSGNENTSHCWSATDGD